MDTKFLTPPIFKNGEKETPDKKPYRLQDVVMAIKQAYLKNDETFPTKFPFYDLISKVAQKQNPEMPVSAFTMDEPEGAKPVQRQQR
ncbi:MAG: hypothetical protein C5B49_13590 [Bdellovibrio sp.]|nr:MAG: hypothetical protein C5B49_13590 [Bdellovibrio sp.]